MRAEGLEPPHLAAPAPKAGVSTNSTTPAAAPIVRHRLGPTCSSSSATLLRCEIEMLRWLDCVHRSPSCSQVLQNSPRLLGTAARIALQHSTMIQRYARSAVMTSWYARPVLEMHPSPRYHPSKYA